MCDFKRDSCGFDFRSGDKKAKRGRLILKIMVEVSRGAVVQVCDCKCDMLLGRFPFGGRKYLIFLFPRSENEQKCEVQFCH